MVTESCHLSYGQIEHEIQKSKDDSGRARRRLAQRVLNQKQRPRQKKPRGFA